MELMHAETYEEAWREIQRLKGSPGDRVDGIVPVYKIVRSPYEGFNIVAVDPDMYADMLSTGFVDGLPTLIALRSIRPGDCVE